MTYYFIIVIAVWPTNQPTTNGPGAASTPNLPTSTPIHQPVIVCRPMVAPKYTSDMVAPKFTSDMVAPKITSEETSLQSSSSNLLNGSSNQLSKAEEKIQGRGMCRSNASYGIQQLLQEQVRLRDTDMINCCAR